jgi:hypothetical protein
VDSAGGVDLPADPFVVAGTRLSSRLLVGTGKFGHPVMRDAVLASRTNLVTVALRRWTWTGSGTATSSTSCRPAYGCCPHLRRGGRRRGRSGWPGSAGPAPAPTGSSSR